MNLLGNKCDAGDIVVDSNDSQCWREERVLSNVVKYIAVSEKGVLQKKKKADLIHREYIVRHCNLDLIKEEQENWWLNQTRSKWMKEKDRQEWVMDNTQWSSVQ